MTHIGTISENSLRTGVLQNCTNVLGRTFGKTALNNVKNHLEANVDVANPWALKWFASSDECSLIN